MKLEEVEIYVTLRDTNVGKFIANIPIMDLCLAAERCPGEQVSYQWWVHGRPYLEGIWAVARALEIAEMEV